MDIVAMVIAVISVEPRQLGDRVECDADGDLVGGVDPWMHRGAGTRASRASRDTCGRGTTGMLKPKGSKQALASYRLLRPMGCAALHNSLGNPRRHRVGALAHTELGSSRHVAHKPD